jgi:hypothetical protein
MHGLDWLPTMLGRVIEAEPTVGFERATNLLDPVGRLVNGPREAGQRLVRRVV